MAEIRPEASGDEPDIRRVVEQAFGGPAEADLVDELRRIGALTLSLVAVQDGRVVGHVAFSPVTIDGLPDDASAVGLAPVAVEPPLQGHGIGSALIREGLDRCREAGHCASVVLGHASYYPRFGYRPASEWGLASEFDSPPEHFMALELRSGALEDCAGQVRYHPAFGAF